MGVPSKVQIETWTDRIAALIQKGLAGFDAELTGAASDSLWAQVDASGDPDVENALLAASLALDRMSLPENYVTALPILLGRAPYRAWVDALTGLVIGSSGGYASLRAYLADKSAQVHPLFAELVRQVQGANAFQESDGDVLTVFTPNYQSRAPERVYTGADGALVDDTVDAQDVGTADVPLFAADNDALYIGSRYKFSHLVAALSTLANVTVTPTFQYWNGNAWTTLTVTDNGVGFTKNDLLKWTIPTDWQRTHKDAGGTPFPGEDTPLYYLRIARTADTVGTPPVATCLRIVPAPVYNGGTVHLGVDQPPLAIARITGVNTIAIESVAPVDHARFREPVAVKLRALTPITGTVTLTFSYVDQGGSNSSQAQGAWSSIDALDTFDLTLAGGDTGVRSVRTDGTSVHTATEGIFEVVAIESRTPAL